MKKFFSVIVLLMLALTGCNGSGNWQELLVEIPAECGAAERVIISAHQRAEQPDDLQSWLEEKAADYCK